MSRHRYDEFEYTENFHDISGAKAVGFYGSVGMVYDVVSCYGHWDVRSITERPPHIESALRDNHVILTGLSVWDILEQMSNDIGLYGTAADITKRYP